MENDVNFSKFTEDSSILLQNILDKLSYAMNHLMLLDQKDYDILTNKFNQNRCILLIYLEQDYKHYVRKNITKITRKIMWKINSFSRNKINESEQIINISQLTKKIDEGYVYTEKQDLQIKYEECKKEMMIKILNVHDRDIKNTSYFWDRLHYFQRRLKIDNFVKLIRLGISNGIITTTEHNLILYDKIRSMIERIEDKKHIANIKNEFYDKIAKKFLNQIVDLFEIDFLIKGDFCYKDIILYNNISSLRDKTIFPVSLYYVKRSEKINNQIINKMINQILSQIVNSKEQKSESSLIYKNILFILQQRIKTLCILAMHCNTNPIILKTYNIIFHRILERNGIANLQINTYQLN